MPPQEAFDELHAFAVETLCSDNPAYWLGHIMNNSTDLSFVPGGYYHPNSSMYNHLLGDAYYWISDTTLSTTKPMCHILYGCPVLEFGTGNAHTGYSVRCVQKMLLEVICPLSGDTAVIQNDGFKYKHSGTGWDATTTTANATLGYTLSGATTGSGTTLNNVTFNPGTTTVKWKATLGAEADSCSFTVKVGYINACSDCYGDTIVRDIDGNVYQAKTMPDGKMWMIENLRTTKYASGVEISERTNQWAYGDEDYKPYFVKPSQATENGGGSFTSDKDTLWGYYYNWAAAVGAPMDTAGNSATWSPTVNTNGHVQGVCPAGWHLPSDAEWAALKDSTWKKISPEDSSALYMSCSSNWSSGLLSTNSSSNRNYTCFSAVPTGYYFNGTVLSSDSNAYFWSATPYGAGGAYEYIFGCNVRRVFCAGSLKYLGFSVRCVRDDAPPSTVDITCPFSGDTTVIQNGGFNYKHSGTGWDATTTVAGATLSYTLSGATMGSGTTLNNVTFNPGATTVTWKATLGAEADSCSFTVKVDFTEMVFVEGGTFTMGCTSEQGADCEDDNREEPSHDVTLNNFYIGKYEVTQKEWREVMGNNPSRFTGDSLPVEQVSWNDIQIFLDSLSRKTGMTWRLPTEAEWEYAARGGKESQGYKYSGSNTAYDVAWYSGNSGFTTHAVGTRAPNELGIYDMSGNVHEWCSDRYKDDYYASSPSDNPTGPVAGSDRVFRGGGWFGDARYVRVSHRNHEGTGRRYINIGFRVVRSADAPPSTVDITCPFSGDTTVIKNDGFNYKHSGTGWDATTTVAGATLSYTLSGATTGSGTTLDNVIFNSGTTKVTWKATLGAEADSCSFTVKVDFTEMVFVEGGTFTMGCTSEQGADCFDNREKPSHDVTLNNFYIGKYEVTQKEWREVMGNNPSRFTGDNLPVEQVSWDDTQIFLDSLSRKTGMTWRLPTEAEWEYAARGGKQSQGYKYSGSNTADDVAWHSGNSGLTTHAVGTKTPNELGIYNMSGNVYEWCSDWYDATYYSSSPSDNPTGPVIGSGRVARGGCWAIITKHSRVSFRANFEPDFRLHNFGLRVARSADAPPSTVDITCPFSGDTTVIKNDGFKYKHSGTGWDATTTVAGATLSYTLSGATTGSGTTLNNVIFNLGTTTVKWKATLGAGADSCSFTVKVDFTEMVFVEGGLFTMGCLDGRDTDCDNDESPAHSVTLSNFYIGKYEVTQKEWREVMGSNPSQFTGDSLPVEQVSWNDTQIFLDSLSRKTGMTWRLPTEAEWEYAARGGNQSQGFKYSGSNTVGDVAWYWNNSENKPHAVGTKAPNELGIYDMSGNVHEWCSDPYDAAYYASSPSDNPTGPIPVTGSIRVLRGGTWYNAARRVRVSYRGGGVPNTYGGDIGFRVARSAD